MKKTLAVLLTLFLSLSAFGITTFADDVSQVTTETVTYIDAGGGEQTVEAVVIVDRIQPYGVSGEPGWYVVKGNMSLSNAIIFNDSEINIILADDCDCSYLQNSFCFIPTSMDAVPMNIYVQENGTGKLTVKTRMGALYGDLNIYGGNITAEGIHADMRNYTECGTITIYDGTVNVDNFYTKNLIINGGTVNAGSTSAIKGDLTINDGTVTVNGPYSYSLALSSTDGKITINGGNITSTGQFGLYASELEINGGTVNATGTGTFGILTKQSLVINGGSVTAQGRQFGIGIDGEEKSVEIGLKTPGASLTVNTAFYPENSYIIADGQTLTDGEKTYSGTLTAAGFIEAVGKTLTCSHNVIVKGAGEATCGAEGYTGDEYCSVCGEKLSEGEIIQPTGNHSFDDQEWTFYDENQHVRFCGTCNEPEYEAHEVIVKGAGEATCGAEGYSGDEYCSVCGERLSIGEVIQPTGNHTTVIVNAKAATATEDGYTGDEVCTVCSKTIKTGEVIPATGSDTPDSPAEGDACPYCGEVHGTNIFERIIKFIHCLYYYVSMIVRAFD